MPFLQPLALAGLVFLPLVVAMYLLKLRRDETVVPSTLLWQRLVADVEANAPWQRLRRSLLLLLQLLLVLILVLLAARPFVERPAGLAGDLVLVIDTSASMQATDVTPSRLDAAKAAAIDALKDLPAGGKVSVIAAGRTAKVVANRTSDLGRVRQAIDGVEATSDIGNLGDALRLASALAARSGDAEILVATDAALATPPGGRVEAPVRVLRVGRVANNQAIVALSVRTASSGLSHGAFISIANLGLELVERQLEVYADGQLRDSRTVYLDPQRRADVSIDDIDDPQHPASVVEVRLKAGDGEEGSTATDPLAVDDRAWAIVPPLTKRQVLLAGEPDPYLETALSYLPDTELYYRSGDDWSTLTGLDRYELVIFNRFLPPTLPAKPILAIAPPTTSALGTVSGTLTNPGIGTLDPTDPILRFVDLSTVHVGEAQRLELPAWARAVVPGPGSSPLLYAGQLDGRPAAVLAFEPRHSDLPLQVAFPVLMANLAGELLGGAGAPADAVAPGTPVTLAVPAGASGVRVERPDGSVDELVAPTKGSASVTFARTDQLGVYTVTGIPDPDASPGATSASGSASAPTSRGSSSAPDSSGAPVAAAADDGSVRFAVDLLDVDESTIAPGDVAKLTALGAAAGGPAASPGASPATGDATGGPASRLNARDELWVPIVLVALLVLTTEWLVYERDTLARLRRAAAARLRRPRPTGRRA
jgi:VWA domain-containing protein/aerotolerance regulator-like protein